MGQIFDETTITWDYETHSSRGEAGVNSVALPWVIRAGGEWTRDGLRIDRVTPGGPATRLTDKSDRVHRSIEGGDTITSVNGIAVLSTDDWVRAIMTAPDPSRIVLSIVRYGASYDWIIAPQWRASDRFPRPIMQAFGTSLSRFATIAFEEACRQQHADSGRVHAVVDCMEAVATAAFRWVDCMSDAERDRVISGLPLVGSGGTAYGPNEAAVDRLGSIAPGMIADATASAGVHQEGLPQAFVPVSLRGDNSVPGVPRGPIQPGHLPQPPDISKPEAWYEGTVSDVEDVAKKVGDQIAAWGEGVAGGVVETIRQLVAKMPIAIAKAFAQMAKHLDDMFRHLRMIFEEGTTLDGAFIAFRNAVLSFCHAVGELVLTSAGMVLDFGVNIIAGLLPTIAAARPLTQSEKDFAHAIFHGGINASVIRLAFHSKAQGLCAANVIWMPRLDLRRMDDRQRFAHELAHVYQDQSPDSAGTWQAAKEFIRHHLDGDSVYSLALSAGTTWEDLGMEQQANLIGLWRTHLDVENDVQGLTDAIVDSIPPEQVSLAAAIVNSKSFY